MPFGTADAGRRAAKAAFVCGLLSTGAFAQETKAQFEVGTQGYFQGQSATGSSGIVGGFGRFREYFAGSGILRGNLEAYANGGTFRTGEMFVEMGNVPWKSRQWSFRGGDFYQSLSLDNLPFGNLIFPYAQIRGVQVRAERADSSYEALAGIETLMEGPRVPFRRHVAQSAAGFRMEHKLSDKLRVGGRVLHLWSSREGLAKQEYLFPYMREALSTTSGAMQVEYSPDSATRVFGEASLSTAEWLRPAERQLKPFGGIAGISRETHRYTVRANYVSQPASYLPLAGYLIGDRQGPFVEARFRPWDRFEVFASASQFRNNLERNPEVRDMHSRTISQGASLQIRRNMMWSGNYGRATLRSEGAGAEARTWDHRMISQTLTTNVRGHSLRFTWRDIDVRNYNLSQRQVAKEIEDYFTLGSFVLGAGVRLDEMRTTESRNTLFFRGSLQWMHRHFSAYANVEAGNDLLNQTLFATQSVSTTLIGISTRLPDGWRLNAEGFRSRYVTSLNPENLFALQNQGVGFVPILSGTNYWNLYFRLNKQYNWGAVVPGIGSGTGVPSDLAARGSLQGYVYEVRTDGKAPAAGVPVGLDMSRKVFTDERGKYEFADVPEGLHSAVLGADALPPEYEPQGQPLVTLSVRAGRVTRQDFELIRLCRLEGRVLAEGILDAGAMERVVIRLRPGKRYTTPSADGTFAFYNLAAGSYEVEMETGALPEGTALTTPQRVQVDVSGDAAPNVEFSVGSLDAHKPVRKVLEKRGVSPAGKTKDTKAPKPRAGASGQAGTCGEWRDGKVVVKPCAEMGAPPEDWLSGKAKAKAKPREKSKASRAANRGAKTRGKQVVRRGNAKRPAKHA